MYARNTIVPALQVLWWSVRRVESIKVIWPSTSEEEIDSLYDKAAAWIRSFGGQQGLDFDDRKRKRSREDRAFS